MKKLIFIYFFFISYGSFAEKEKENALLIEFFLFQKADLNLANKNLFIREYKSNNKLNNQKGDLLEIKRYDSLGRCVYRGFGSATKRNFIYKTQVANYDKNGKLTNIIMSIPKIYSSNFIYDFKYISDTVVQVICRFNNVIPDTLNYEFSNLKKLKRRNNTCFIYNSKGLLELIKNNNDTIEYNVYEGYNVLTSRFSSSFMNYTYLNNSREILYCYDRICSLKVQKTVEFYTGDKLIYKVYRKTYEINKEEEVLYFYENGLIKKEEFYKLDNKKRKLKLIVVYTYS